MLDEVFMSFLKDVIEKLYKETDINYWKNEFSEISKDDLNSLAKKIKDIIKTEFNTKKNSFKDYQNTSENENKRNQVTFVEGKPWRREEALERLLILFDNLTNQKTTPDGGHVDIVFKTPDGQEKFIELKMCSEKYMSNTPLFAFIESLKNKYLIENISDTPCEELKKVSHKDGEPQVNELIILAPFDYYKKYYINNPKSVENLYLLKDIYNEEYKITIVFKSLNISLQEWDDLIDFISKNCDIVPASKKEKNGRNYKVINFMSNKDKIEKYAKINLKDKFEIKKWKTLNYAKNWDFK